MYCLHGSDGKTKLEYILAPQFFTPVLIGGVALLVLIAMRALTLWQEAGTCPRGTYPRTIPRQVVAANVHIGHETFGATCHSETSLTIDEGQ